MTVIPSQRLTQEPTFSPLKKIPCQVARNGGDRAEHGDTAAAARRGTVCRLGGALLAWGYISTLASRKKIPLPKKKKKKRVVKYVPVSYSQISECHISSDRRSVSLSHTQITIICFYENPIHANEEGRGVIFFHAERERESPQREHGPPRLHPITSLGTQRSD